MTEIILTKKQIEELAKIVKKDKTIAEVILIKEHVSGIGTSIKIKYTKVKDITDVDNW